MDLRQKIVKWLVSAVPVLWFFVAGIGIGIAIYSNDITTNYFEKYRSVLLLLSLTFFLFSFLLPKKELLPKFSLKRLMAIFASCFFGIFWYLKTAQINSTTHLLAEENGKYKFIDTDISQSTIVYGTIVSDPDIREDSTNIVIRPDIIIPEPNKYTLAVDTSTTQVIVEEDVITRVIDGDTCETKNGQKIRLMGINAPEIGQPKSDDATKFLEQKVLNKKVKLIIQKDYIFDPYDRVLAIVFVENENINKSLLDNGLAEYYDDPNIQIVKKQTSGEMIKLEGNCGLIRAKVLPTIGNYYFEMGYGDYVKIVSPLLLPRKATNPAGFDYRRYLNARGIYAVTKTLREEKEIEYLGVGKLNKFVKLAYFLRKKMLLCIRKTVPYPQSAFLGGVTLGYRGGVPTKIRQEFQATGVAHVLALSGLHTGFVAALLLIICNIFKIKSFLRFILVSIALTIFAIMTGASPATVRSALMFCTGLFIYEILKQSLANTARVTIIIAASSILFFNPRLLPEASFVLSFMAVWSLVYVAPTVEKILLYSDSKLVHQFLTFPLFCVITGMTFISLIGGILQEVAIVRKIFPFLTQLPPLENLFPKWFNIESSSWLYKGEFFLLSIAFYFCGIIIHYLYSLSGKMLVKDMRTLSPFFRGLIQFVSAQVAIQLGMMWPLSSVYFYRFPISGFYANFVAIPLIGWIVQLGWIAGLINMLFDFVSYISGIKFISTIGINIALLINAFNTQLCQMFLGMAKLWGNFVPYPYVEMFSSESLVLWYSILGIIIWFEKIKQVVRLYKVQSVIILLLILIFGVYYLFPWIKKSKKVEVIFFDVGFGNAVLVKTPTKNVLIDTGPPGPSNWSPAESVISPTLTKYKIKKLDIVVLTSLKPQNIGGTVHILTHFPTKKIYLPGNFIDCSSFTYYDFIEKSNLWYYMTNPYLYEVTGLFIENYKLSQFIKKYNAEKHIVSDTEIIVDEVIDGKKFIMKIINVGKIKNTTDEIGNNSLCVKLTFANNSVLIPTQAAVELQNVLVSKLQQNLQSEVLLVPQNGHYNAYNELFVRTVSPKLAICQYGWTNQRIGYFYPSYVVPTQSRYMSLGIKFLRTDYVGAVILYLDAEGYRYTTCVSEKEYKIKLATEQLQES